MRRSDPISFIATDPFDQKSRDGQLLTKEPLKIEDGKLTLQDHAGLGIEIDMNQIEEAHSYI